MSFGYNSPKYVDANNSNKRRKCTKLDSLNSFNFKGEKCLFHMWFDTVRCRHEIFFCFLLEDGDKL